MSQEDLDALKNASVIIERFGGIRPMAAKVGAPVTTVQGWKKRDVIPGARRDDVLKAANENSIDISDLLTDGPRLGGTTISSLEKSASAETAFNDNSEEAKITVEPIVRPQPRPLPASLQPRIDTTHEELMAAIAQGQKKAVRASVWTVIAFSVLLGGAAAFALWPSAQKIEKHEDQIANLEGKVGAMDNDVQALNEGVGFVKDMVPDDIRDRLANLRKEADAITQDVKNTAKQVQDISKGVLATDAGSLSDRLSVLEAKLADVEGGQAVKDLTARIRGLEVTMAGQAQLADSVAELSKNCRCNRWSGKPAGRPDGANPANAGQRAGTNAGRYFG
jgi:peptidoglycan hydrolase CwlO-like protein